jgi:hypothetical protein
MKGYLVLSIVNRRMIAAGRRIGADINLTQDALIAYNQRKFINP